MKKVEPIDRLLRASVDAGDPDSDKVLTDLFFTAAHADAPEEWRRALRAKTKQLRRSLSYQRRAVELAAKGRRDEAFERLDQAEAILRQSSDSLGVDFLGPTLTGFMDLWKWVRRGAMERFHDNVKEVLREIDKDKE